MARGWNTVPATPEVLAAKAIQRRYNKRVTRVLRSERLETMQAAEALSKPTAKRMDATNERLSKGDYSESCNPALIDSNEQAPTTTRIFKSTLLDRLHRNGKLTYHQWLAGDWYRNTAHRAAQSGVSIANYGERSGAIELAYGLPRTEGQAEARKQLRQARDQWTQGMQGFMDRLLIHDNLPRYGRRQNMRNLAEIRKALDVLVRHLRYLPD